jgi:hypothetical protein
MEEGEGPIADGREKIHALQFNRPWLGALARVSTRVQTQTIQTGSDRTSMSPT